MFRIKLVLVFMEIIYFNSTEKFQISLFWVLIRIIRRFHLKKAVNIALVNDSEYLFSDPFKS